MTVVERIERMLESEERTRARCRGEVTVDPAEVTAEIRAGAFREVLAVLDNHSGKTPETKTNEVKP